MTDREAELQEALESMARQFAYWHEAVGGLHTGGLSALEHAFDLLGWEDPQPMPDLRCDEPECLLQATCGWPTGLEEPRYRRTCHKHYRR